MNAEEEYVARVTWSNRMLAALASNDSHGWGEGRTHCKCGRSFWDTASLGRHLEENYTNMAELAATHP